MLKKISIISDSFYCSEGLGEGYDGDIAFASALETFGGGHNDPISVAFGGMLLIIVFWSLFVRANADKKVDPPLPTFVSLEKSNALKVFLLLSFMSVECR